MQEETTYEFSAPSFGGLNLTNLAGNVRVVVGDRETASVTVSGSAAARERVDVTIDDITKSIRVTGPERQLNIGNGSVVIGNVNGSTVISGVVINASANRVVINGVDVTAAASASRHQEPEADVVITVPFATPLVINGCADVISRGLDGGTRVHAHADDRVVVEDAGSASLRAAQSASIAVTGVRETLIADATQSATIRAAGRAGLAMLKVSQSGSIHADGSFSTLNATATQSGRVDVNATSRVEEVAVDATMSGTIRVRGDVGSVDGTVSMSGALEIDATTAPVNVTRSMGGTVTVGGVPLRDAARGRGGMGW